MLVRSLNFFNTPKINFGSSTVPLLTGDEVSTRDMFCKSKPVGFKFTPEVSRTAEFQIFQQVKDIQTNNLPPLGIGATGIAFKLDNIEGFAPYGVVAKFSHKEKTNPITKQKQKPLCNFDDEIAKLKKAEALKDDAQQYLGRFELDDGRYVLITTFVGGQSPNVVTRPLNKENLSSIIDVLYRLDSAQVLHRDLKSENILIDQNNKAKLIDFGEAIDFNFLDKETNVNSLNFAPFEFPNNFQSFEDTLLSPYINELQKQNPKEAYELYRNYLKQKADNVYSRRASELNEYLAQNPDLEAQKADYVRKMADYQSTMAKVFGNQKINNSIIELELMRNQVTYLSELAYKNEILLANPRANITLKANALISAKKLESMAKTQLASLNTVETKGYCKYLVEIAKFRQEIIAGWLNGFVGWFCTCMTTDINTDDKNKKQLINECVQAENLEEFEIPNIAKRGNQN